ncbi:MAG: MetS family NSS transporter small subunit [Actinomycetaceae bacterium]|nr:MetS family NSS transporter small subunit [Arcanobacterium sp.]MDD7686588.1 MetS family NSS transporter small subunit [Actinomycetaceae bacterium]MDY5273094.1 MetS family NSS transporter small subunit [Arcanobacterium sp.]
MTGSAIALMCGAMIVIWGGLGASITYLVTHPMRDEDEASQVK